MQGESEGEVYLVLWTCICSNVAAFPYFPSAEVEIIKYITFTLAQLLDIIQFLNGEHRAKVIVHCVDYVIVGCDNNSIQSFEWHYVVPYYSSLVDIRVDAIGIVFANSL